MWTRPTAVLLGFATFGSLGLPGREAESAEKTITAKATPADKPVLGTRAKMNSSRTVAESVDKLILEHLAKEAGKPSALTSDEDYLRRVYLDLSGTVPSAKEVTLFVLDSDPDKRTKVVDKLLESDDYSETWASYWRDVIFSRATNQRARIVQDLFESWLKDQFKANVAWDKVATELITATGNTEKDGKIGLVFAHEGDPTEIASEVSRIFLGIQIQCANCHNHPYDKWTREEFHTLAAYFPRIQVRRDPDAGLRSFDVVSADFLERQGNRQGIDPEQAFRFMDRNRDGMLTKDEARGQLATRFDNILGLADKNKDGKLSPEELKDIPRPPANQPGRGSAEHYMPDLNDPQSKGTLMEPVFFIDKSKLREGADDQERRLTLATHITSKTNPWFAKAYVNRVWAEMLGEGFYMPLDDLGPLREAQYPEVLNVLARGFIAQDYDVRWLFRTIAMTEAYQRQLQGSEGSSLNGPAFAAASPTRLRSDQIYNELTSVLGISNLGIAGGRGGPMGRIPLSQKQAFSAIFGFDPSTPQEDILGTVPQALFLMNNPTIQRMMSGTGNTRLARILKDFPSDEDAIIELYLIILAREPSKREIELNVALIKDVGSRTEAFEDILWSLLNSSEFVTKR
jgi:Ca2+-binding EF-hand superfamily protein